MTSLTTVKRKKFSTVTVTAVFFLVAAAILSVSAAPVLAATTPDTSWYNLTDTSFIISKDVQLAGLAQLVNATSPVSDDFNGRKIIISGNINLSAFTNWVPIGNAAHSFEGIFEGNGKTISKLSVDFGTGTGPAGLFGNIGKGGKVQNLNLRGINIKGGTGDTGGIAGTSDGSITKCTVSGTVNGKTTQNTGGVAGNNGSNGTITDCTVVSGSTIIGTAGKTGALSGLNNGAVNRNTVNKDVKVNGVPVNQNNLVGSGKAPTNTSIRNPLVHGKKRSGCDAGFGFAGFAALAGAALIYRRKEQ
jgi:hypothetical protein